MCLSNRREKLTWKDELYENASRPLQSTGTKLWSFVTTISTARTHLQDIRVLKRRISRAHWAIKLTDKTSCWTYLAEPVLKQYACINNVIFFRYLDTSHLDVTVLSISFSAANGEVQDNTGASSQDFMNFIHSQLQYWTWRHDKVRQACSNCSWFVLDHPLFNLVCRWR